MPKKPENDPKSNKNKDSKKQNNKNQNTPPITHTDTPIPTPPVEIAPGHTLGQVPGLPPFTARTRADVDVFSSPRIKGERLGDRFPTDCLVEVSEDQDGWCKITPVNMQRANSGYVPHAALIFPNPPALPNASPLPAATLLPPTTLLADFQAWQVLGGQPTWIDNATWASLDAAGQTAVREALLAPVLANQARWDAWQADVTLASRLGEACMDEWTVILAGGREVFVIRDHYVYKTPVQNGSYFGCASRGQIMRWTGGVRFNLEDGKKVTFYDVEFYRMSLFMRGWFRADLTAEYIYPSTQNDPHVPANAANVFDLSVSLLRHPQDPEISPERQKGINGAQYIDVFRATKRHLVHWSLCGEFCIAALAGSDIIPTLQMWVESHYTYIHEILDNPHMGTNLSNLRSILDLFGMTYQEYSSIPTSPRRVKDRLQQGEFVLAGCGINRSGDVLSDGTIRHWVVILDVLPAGNSGWVRVYNPFFNREEVYEYNLFMTSSGVGAGMWIRPKATPPTPVLP